jgi:ribosomal 50S subunit-recycling heat shock protein
LSKYWVATRAYPYKRKKVNKMRVDKWLASVNVIKRRTVASDMVKSGVVYINGLKAKASKNVAVGDKITIEYLKGAKNYEVLQIPTTKTIPKSKKEEYFKEL